MRYVILLFLFITAFSLPDPVQDKKEIQIQKEEPVQEIVKEQVVLDYPINKKPKAKWNDFDWMAKMLMSETPDSTDVEGLRYMAISAVLRANMAKVSIIKAITYPRAYSGVNLDSYIWWRAEPTSVHKAIARDLVENGIRESDPKIYAFCNMSIISEKNRRWFRTLKFYKKIGEVTFFLLK
jgi:hypothetical protein